MVTVADLIRELENIAPPELADDGDKIGLQAGDKSKEIRKVVVTVDVTPEVLYRAIDHGADMILAHHPLIFNPLASIDISDPIAARVAKLIKSDTALYVMHTNFDSAPGGINDILAEKLGVGGAQPLTNRRQDKYYKIVVFVPVEAVEHVRNAMAEAGAGRIGQYTHCSFRAPGTGSFVPLPSARPHIGQIEKLEEVEEYRLEMLCVGSWLDFVVSEMLEKHPYDEVAYDIYELANQPVIYGYGRVGTLDKEMTLTDFSQRVKEALDLVHMRVSGNPERTVKTVALCGGNGSSLFKEAIKASADVYVTGDTKHHDRLDAETYGLAMIDAGHFETEKPGMVVLAEALNKLFSGCELEFEYID